MANDTVRANDGQTAPQAGAPAVYHRVDVQPVVGDAPRWRLVLAVAVVRADSMMDDQFRRIIVNGRSGRTVVEALVIEGNTVQLFQSALRRLLSLFGMADEIAREGEHG